MKKVMIVEPCKSVGSVMFGAARDSVRKQFGEFREFKKSKFSRNSTDDFGFAHAYYNEANECVAIELFDDCIVMVGGDCLLPCDQVSFNDWLKMHDAEAIIQGSDSTSNALSIGAAASGGKIDSILFGVRGYYA